MLLCVNSHNKYYINKKITDGVAIPAKVCLLGSVQVPFVKSSRTLRTEM